MKCSIIVPGHNEEEYIGRFLQKLRNLELPIVCVDDGSSDRTLAIAKNYATYTLSHAINLGKGAAMKTGAEFAFEKLGMDAVIFMDADDQHDPKEIPKFIKALQTSDVVFGVRTMGGETPLLRFLGNKLVSVLLNLLFGSYIPDIPSGYKALTKKGYQIASWKSLGYEVETEIAMRVARSKARFVTVAIESIYHDTDKGMTLLDAVRICLSLLEWRLELW